MSWTSIPPTPSLLASNSALLLQDSWVYYVGYDGTVYHLSGPFAPTPGAENGFDLVSITGLHAPFKHLDNQGARQDGTTWFDSVYDPGLIEMVIEVSGMSPKLYREMMASWYGSWDPKQVGKLCWFSPERGEWYANVRQAKTIPDQFVRSPYQSGRVKFTWSARNDDAFWKGPASVSTFALNAIQEIATTGTSGTFTLTYRGQTTAAIPYNATAAQLQSALGALSNIGSANISVTDTAGGAPWLVTFQGTLGATAVPVLTADSTHLNGGFTTVTVVNGGNITIGHLPLTNIGDQPGWPSYLCYGPGTFSFGDGPSPTNNLTNPIQFGPLMKNQIALLTTLPRLRTVVDLSPNQPPQPLGFFQSLIATIINFVTVNNVPPLLQEFESIFGIQPPQGPFYSLLNGRFTQPVPPMAIQTGPVTSFIPCQITGGNGASKIVASLTPMRKWPE
jgi:hypothetical protein